MRMSSGMGMSPDYSVIHSVTLCYSVLRPSLGHVLRLEPLHIEWFGNEPDYADTACEEARSPALRPQVCLQPRLEVGGRGKWAWQLNHAHLSSASTPSHSHCISHHQPLSHPSPPPTLTAPTLTSHPHLLPPSLLPPSLLPPSPPPTLTSSHPHLLPPSLLPSSLLPPSPPPTLTSSHPHCFHPHLLPPSLLPPSLLPPSLLPPSPPPTLTAPTLTSSHPHLLPPSLLPFPLISLVYSSLLPFLRSSYHIWRSLLTPFPSPHSPLIHLSPHSLPPSLPPSLSPSLLPSLPPSFPLSLLPHLSSLLATTSADGLCKIWSTADFSLRNTLKKSPEKWVWDCAFSSDSQYIFTGERVRLRGRE